MKKLLFAILFISVSLFSFSLFAKRENVTPDSFDNIDNSVIIARINNDDIEISIPKVIFSFSEVDVKLKFKNPEHTRLLYNNNKIVFVINGEERSLNFINGKSSFKRKFDTDNILSIFTEGFSYNHKVMVIHLWMIIAPIVLFVFLTVFFLFRRK